MVTRAPALPAIAPLGATYTTRAHCCAYQLNDVAQAADVTAGRVQRDQQCSACRRSASSMPRPILRHGRRDPGRCVQDQDERLICLSLRGRDRFTSMAPAPIRIGQISLFLCGDYNAHDLGQRAHASALVMPAGA
jgi:hypothetical protein